MSKLRLEKELGFGVETDVSLAGHTSFGIGGGAAYFARVDDVALLGRAIAAARHLSIPTLILGGGTNLLVADEGFDGFALAVATGGITVDADGRRVTVGAGVAMGDLVATLVADGIAGLEFAAGLPGTVGGAVAGNAGCFGGSMGDVVVGATVVLEDGTTARIEDPAWFAFDYRRSRLLGSGAVVTEVTFATGPGERARIEEIAAANLAVRHEKHPGEGVRTAGSYFKNLPPSAPGERRRAAGALLDAVGAKEMRVGGAAVFERHANIVVNAGGATAKDVLALAEKMRAAVRETFGVELEPEVRYVR